MAIYVEDPGYREGELNVPKRKYVIRVCRVGETPLATAEEAQEAYEKWKEGWDEQKTQAARERYEREHKRPAKVIHTIPVYPHLYPLLLGAYLVLHLLIAAAVIIFGQAEGAILAPWAMGVLMLQALHFLFAFTRVKETDKGGILFWGKPVKEVQSGWQFVPMGLLQMRVFPRGLILQQFPGPLEKTYRGGESGTDKAFFELPKEEREGLQLPIRMTTGGKKRRAKEGLGELDILDTQMTAEVEFYVRWRIEHFWVFVVRMHETDRAKEQFRYSAQRTIFEEIAKRTPKQIINQIAEINETLHGELEALTEDWGVYIVEAALLSPDLSHGVNVELRNVTSEKARAAQKVINAEAEEVRLTREGQGKANAIRAELQAFAEGANALGLDGQAVIDLEKTRALSGGKTTIFIDGGQNSSSLLGLGARLATGGSEALRHQSSSNEKEAENG